MYIVLAEEVVVEVDELHLTHSGEELALFNRVEHVIDLQLIPAASNSTARHQYHLVVMPAQPGYLVNKRRHAGDVEFAFVCCEHVAAHLHYDSPFHSSRV